MVVYFFQMAFYQSNNKEMIIPLVGAEYKEQVINEIDRARRNIDITMFEWRYYYDDILHPVQQINLALLRANRRGVQVRALLDKPLILEELNSIGVQAKIPKEKRLLHSKLVLIDAETTIIGSHNLTKNALTSNLETSVILKDKEVTKRFTEYFDFLYF